MAWISTIANLCTIAGAVAAAVTFLYKKTPMKFHNILYSIAAGSAISEIRGFGTLRCFLQKRTHR